MPDLFPIALGRSRAAVALILLFGCALLCPLNQARAWDLVEHEKRDYISVSSIVEFYGFQKEVDGKHVWLRSPSIVVKGTVGSQSLLINQIKFILSYPLLALDGQLLVSRLDLCKLIDPVIRPRFIRNAQPFKTVIIDPGHGGHDSGAGGAYGSEKEFALKLAHQLKTHLEPKGFKVVFTRDGDYYLTLAERVAVANKHKDAIFVSLHFNYGGSAASGIETFALSPYGAESTINGPANSDYRSFAGNQRDSENIALATAVHASVLKNARVVDRGIKRARWAVLKGINMPAILFEGGFLTNRAECKKVANPAYREVLAGSIADAIGNFRVALTSPVGSGG